MAVFTVTSNDVLLGTGAVDANDPFNKGVLKNKTNGMLNRATTGAGNATVEISKVALRKIT